MSYSEDEIKDAIKTQTLVCEKLLEIMELQGDIDSLYETPILHPSVQPDGRTLVPKNFTRLVMMTAIQFVCFEPNDWVDGNRELKVAAETVSRTDFVTTQVAQREVSLNTGRYLTGGVDDGQSGSFRSGLSFGQPPTDFIDTARAGSHSVRWTFQTPRLHANTLARNSI